MDRCPKCGGTMRETAKHTVTGEDWREYTCRACGHVADEHRGPALWKILSDDHEEREAFDRLKGKLPAPAAAAGKEEFVRRLRAGEAEAVRALTGIVEKTRDRDEAFAAVRLIKKTPSAAAELEQLLLRPGPVVEKVVLAQAASREVASSEVQGNGIATAVARLLLEAGGDREAFEGLVWACSDLKWWMQPEVLAGAARAFLLDWGDRQVSTPDVGPIERFVVAADPEGPRPTDGTGTLLHDADSCLSALRSALRVAAASLVKERGGPFTAAAAARLMR